MPTIQLGIEVDITPSPSGSLSGTISTPEQKLTGLPLSKIDVNGAVISFAARTDQGFDGTLSADGNTISGYFTMSEYTFPFAMTRMGAAKVTPRPTSAPITTRLAGTWTATLMENGTANRLVLKFANLPQGGSVGSVVNLDEGSLEIPLANINENGLNITFGSKVLDVSYLARMNDEHTELTGTWMQGTSHMQITFKRESVR